MRFREYGFGMFGWEGSEIAVAGGMRDEGFHPAGQVRARFAAFARLPGKQKATEIAQLVLLVNLANEEGQEPKVAGIINIEVAKEYRGQGFGRAIVSGLSKVAGGDVEIFDIRKSAIGFWKKVGAEGFRKNGARTEAILPMHERPSAAPESVPSLVDHGMRAL